MAFVFPQDKQDFKAANGITYTYREGKWLVKTFKDAPPDLSGFVTTEDFEQDQKRQDDDIEAGYDTQSDLLLNKIDQDKRLDDLDTAVEGLNNSQGVQDERLNELDGEVDGLHDSQEVQDNQINALETQIQLLAKASGGVWRYERNVSGTSPRPPGGSRFYGTHSTGVDTVLTSWSDLRLLMVNKSDVNGTNFVFTNFEIGDKIEIIATDASSLCIGTIETAATQDSYGNMVVNPDRTNGGPEEGKEYLISVFRPGEEGGSSIDTDVLDQRYLQLTGGTLSNSFKIQRGEEKTHPQFKISPNGGADYATNIYTLEGQMRFRTSHTGQEKDNIGSHIVLDPADGTPTTKIYKLGNPTSSDMAANKGYVDGRTPDATNLVKGVTYKGQACVTGNSTPDSSSFSQGQLIFSTSSNSLYIRT